MYYRKESDISQSCPTLCNPKDMAPPSMEFFQARVLDWVAISYPRGSSQPRKQTLVSRVVSSHFTVWATRESQGMYYRK